MDRRRDSKSNILKQAQKGLSLFLDKKSVIAACVALIPLSAQAERITPPPATTQTTTPTERLQQLTFDVAPFIAEYDVETNALPLSGDGIRSLRHLGSGRYRMEQIAKSFLLTRREISEFKMKNCNIKPLSYRYEQSGIGRDSRQLLDFSADQSEVTYEADKKQQQIILPQDRRIYDRLSETIALQCLLIERGAEPDTLKDPLKLTVVDKGSIRDHVFAITSTETIQMAKSEMKALRVERVRDTDDRQTILWFAPGHNYALIKMQQINDGKTITFSLKSIKQIF